MRLGFWPKENYPVNSFILTEPCSRSPHQFSNIIRAEFGGFAQHLNIVRAGSGFEKLDTTRTRPQHAEVVNPRF